MDVYESFVKSLMIFPTHWALLQYSSIVRKQTHSLICVAHCDELAK